MNRKPNSNRTRPGFTLIEMLIVIVVLGSIAAIGLPRMNQTIRQRRVIAATHALSGDIEAAFSLAARQRRPIRLIYDSPSGELRVTDRTVGTVYRKRALLFSSEYKLGAAVMSAASIDLFPNGLASSPFNITLTSGAFSRQVAVTRTGLTRVIVQ